MKRALIVATVFKFLNFEKGDIQILQNMGYEVHTATNMKEADWLRDDGTFDEINMINHQVDFERSPFTFSNIKAYKQLKLLIKEYRFELIHCHTSVAAAITRLAAIMERKKGAYVIYTCHGFHFHSKSGWKNWLIYYSIEKILALVTDMIITINREDYNIIKKFPVKECRYIPGVGVDIDHIINLNVDRKEVLNSLEIPENAFVILSIGELSARKNQTVIIDAIAKLRDDNIYYILCGTGDMYNELMTLARKRKIANQVVFTGQKEHEWVLKLCHAIDIGAIPSTIEGLGLAGIEILAAGKPLIGSDIQGINDYLFNGKNGFSCCPNDISGFSKAIHKLMTNKELYGLFSKNAKKIARHFDVSKSKFLMVQNYLYAQEAVNKDNSNEYKKKK